MARPKLVHRGDRDRERAARSRVGERREHAWRARRPSPTFNMFTSPSKVTHCFVTTRLDIGNRGPDVQTPGLFRGCPAGWAAAPVTASCRERRDDTPVRVYLWPMGEKMQKAISVVWGLLATIVTGALTASTSQPAASAETAAPTRQPARFTVSSFNVLGSSHTPAGGTRAVGTTRIVWAHELLIQHHVDVAGFQEMQPDQAEKFLSITNGKWALYPGLTAVRRDSENSIGWRTDKFHLVQATTLRIPYFNGNPRVMPVVLLRDKATGALTYFMNYHNPANTSRFPNQGYWRLEATRVEIALSNQLAPVGIPRIVTGDMNERATYFCRVTEQTPLKAARGGSWRDGVCDAQKPRAVDWIFGSKRLTFSNYLEDRSALVATTTDHPVIVSDVRVGPRKFPNAYGTAPAPVVGMLTY